MSAVVESRPRVWYWGLALVALPVANLAAAFGIDGVVPGVDGAWWPAAICLMAGSASILGAVGYWHRFHLGLVVLAVVEMVAATFALTFVLVIGAIWLCDCMA